MALLMLVSRFVTTDKTSHDNRVGVLYLIRSYDHDKPPRSILDANRARTNTSNNLSIAGPQRTKTVNYEKAQDFEIWQVARAATAAKLYFKPLIIENSRTEGHIAFTDGGFRLVNNPTKRGMREIETLHGDSTVGAVVSVGTARMENADKGKGLFSTLVTFTKDTSDIATDPEQTHHSIDQELERLPETSRFPYYRLNDPGALDIELDNWKPRHKFSNRIEGSQTIGDIQHAFNSWASKTETIEILKSCAACLVARRRRRMWTPQWERYSTGAQYQCTVNTCQLEDFFERGKFEEHLRSAHSVKDAEISEYAKANRKCWKYQAPDGG